MTGDQAGVRVALCREQARRGAFTDPDRIR